MSTTTDYNQQATSILDTMGVSFKAVYASHGRHFIGETTTRDIFNITLSRGKEKVSFKWGQSIANQGQAPSAYDVLATTEKNDPGEFMEFCREFGYEPTENDSKRIYRAVSSLFEKMSAFFTDEEMEQLQEIQ
jgi:hypothetical protein